MKNQKNNDDRQGNNEFEEMELQHFAKMNPYDLSEGSITKYNLIMSMRKRLASSYSSLVEDSIDEIKKIREGSIAFILNELVSIKECQYSEIDTYMEQQIEILEQIVKSFEKSVMTMLSTFNEEFGKTEHN